MGFCCASASVYRPLYVSFVFHSPRAGLPLSLPRSSLTVRLLFQAFPDFGFVCIS